MKVTRYTVTTAASVFPINEAFAKTGLRIPENQQIHNAEILDLIKSATNRLEENFKTIFLETELTAYLDRFPSNGKEEIRLPMPPCIEVTTIKYYDTDNNLQTLAASKYQVDTVSQPARIVPDPDETWPDTKFQRVNAVEILFKAGFGTAATDVPMGIRQAISQLVNEWFKEPGAVRTGTISKKVEYGVENALQPYGFKEVH